LNSRRDFIRNIFWGTALLTISNSKLYALAKNHLMQLTILHTNDVHSRIESYPDNHPRFAGRGGFARRASIINNIRKEQKNVLLFDAGDFLQGTPYFNEFGGKLEVKLMSEMGYDAAVIGNHEFDNGLDGLKNILSYAQFPLLSCNYDFSNIILKGHIPPYMVIEKDGIRIGVLGVGIELRGLVSAAMYGDTLYTDPIKKANETAAYLKDNENCHFIVCLSHLGLEYESDKVSDVVLAKKSYNIDLIIGGHTHVFLEKPYVHTNALGKQVVICQAGHSGLYLGRLDFIFERKSKKVLATYYTTKKIKNQG